MSMFSVGGRTSVSGVPGPVRPDSEAVTAPSGLVCTTANPSFRCAQAVTRNPLLVQFWLLGVDAARGDLAALGFERTSAPFGSSAYSRGNLTLHSAGLWLTRPDGTWQYARWRETFSRAPSVRASAKQPDVDASPAPWAVPERAVVVQRAEGLRAVRASFVAYEADLARRRGRSYRAELLSGRLPPRVRRLVPAWEGWVARHVVFGPAVLSGDLDAIVKINYQ